MYRRPKFLEIIDEIRQEMSREADYDVDLFAEMIRNEKGDKEKKEENKGIQALDLSEISKQSTQIKK